MKLCSNESEYKREINNLFEWCRSNNLVLNIISKTRELIINFRKGNQNNYTPVFIGGMVVERVNSFRFPGVDIDDLSWA